MASKIKLTPQTQEVPEKGAPATPPDPPLLDLSDASHKTLLRHARDSGYMTHDQINTLLKEINSEQIEDILAMFSGMGINVVEPEKASDNEERDEEPEEETESESAELLEVRRKVPTKSDVKKPIERTDDPVRMYLREMGSVELLSREGEIAIAKRIEAGRDAMIAGLCESPLTFQAIIIWRDELNEGKILLRDIIDLEATYEGPEAKIPPPVIPGEIPRPPQAADGEEPRPEGELDDDDDYENALSLAALDAELKPKGLETFHNIAGPYKKLRRQQDKKREQQVAGEQGSKQQQKAYEKARDEIIVAVKSLSLNN